MSAWVQQPHDKLFRTVFSDIEEAALFLREHLPVSLVGQIEWSSLRLVETGFVDEALRDSKSDLLYTAQMRRSEATLMLYLLCEHQSQPDAVDALSAAEVHVSHLGRVVQGAAGAERAAGDCAGSLLPG